MYKFLYQKHKSSGRLMGYWYRNDSGKTQGYSPKEPLSPVTQI